jgi:hypothetical protein
MFPVPWLLFQKIVARETKRTSHVLGDLDDHHRLVHHFVVRELPRTAVPMSPEYISQGLDMPLDQVIPIVDELEGRKIFLFRPGGREIEWAYPVTVTPTPHLVEFSSGERINAA